MNYFLGLDISTTGSKALLIDSNGVVVASHSSPHTLQTPQPLWSEQDPKEWWDAAAASIKATLQKAKVDPASIKAVGLTGQMHGLVTLDAQGDVLRPAILWNDQRTQAQCDEILERVGRDKYISITGNVTLTGFTAPKILWVAQHEPGVYARISHILLPKDYIRFCLTGAYAMDKADGSGTVLFDLKKRDWSREILDALKIDPEWLPKTYEGPEITGTVSRASAELTGLLEGTPVVAGGGDQSTQAIGVGAVAPGIVSLTVGTSGVVFATTPEAMIEPQGRLHAFCHAVPGVWHFMGVMLSAAGSLQWYRDTLVPGLDFTELTKEARRVQAGSEGLMFLPYLSGERTPHPDPKARGSFIGLTLRHKREHMTRAVLEGVSYGLKKILNLIHDSGMSQSMQIRISGGGTKSAAWRQILASILDCELVTVNETEGAAYGAAILAGVGMQNWPDVPTACENLIRITDHVYPDSKDVQVYKEQYEVFKTLYPALKSSFSKLR